MGGIDNQASFDMPTRQESNKATPSHSDPAQAKKFLHAYNGVAKPTFEKRNWRVSESLRRSLASYQFD